MTEKFTQLNQLLLYYQSGKLFNNKFKLGKVCKKGGVNLPTDVSADNSSICAKATPSVSDKAWYHGDVSRVEAEQALAASGNDCFLIRESGKSLVLSLIHHGQVHHVNIQYGPDWYKLESSSAPKFIELENLVSYYRVSDALGVACTTKLQGKRIFFQ